MVLDRSGKAVMPCTEKRAKPLLERGRARVRSVVPFVARVVDRQREHHRLRGLRTKISPSSKATRLTLVLDAKQLAPDPGEIQRGAIVLSLFELVHRGCQISEALTARSVNQVPGAVQGISQSHCRLIQRSVGYGYSRRAFAKGQAGARESAALPALSLLGLKAGVFRAI